MKKPFLILVLYFQNQSILQHVTTAFEISNYWKKNFFFLKKTLLVLKNTKTNFTWLPAYKTQIWH